MVNRGFVVGLSEGLGIIVLGSSHASALLWVPIFAAVYFCVRQRAWVLPKVPAKPFKLFLQGFLFTIRLSLMFGLAQNFTCSLALLTTLAPKLSQLNIDKGTAVAQLLVWGCLGFLISFEYGLGAAFTSVLTSVLYHIENSLAKPLHNKDTHKSHSLSMVAASFSALALYVVGRIFDLWPTAYSNEDAFKVLMESLLVAAVLRVLPHILSTGSLNPKHLAAGLLTAVLSSCFIDPSEAKFTAICLILVAFEYSLRNSEEEVLPLKSAVGFWKLVFSHADSRRLASFLLVNLGFMGVEAAYGYWTNSLGLISDSVHMAFDCTALAIGLYASYLSRLPADRTFTYGHGRFEVLSGLINAIFLVFVGFRVFAESIERIMEPPEISTDNLILVSVLGLIVNLVGLCFFHDHSHGGEDGNSNMRGVFLHVLADTLGSVGVITSSIFVHSLKWYIADPICSLIISLFIFLSCLPLLSDSMQVLTNKDISKAAAKAKKLLKAVPGIHKIEAVHAWTLKSSFHVVTARVRAEVGADCNSLTLACKEALAQFKSVTVQVQSADK
mmetsp:Transcript_29998/g.53213  ORF Transcript_29998/g.53213 Transcript_29998/m.53213 type:complete len:555 (+) Transcript_29998:1261-2925(+)